MMHNVLIITGDDATAESLSDVLAAAGSGEFAVLRTRGLAEASNRLQAGGIDAIMADISLPDSQGVNTFDKLYAVAKHTPIMILSAAEDETLTTEAVQHGAQGYLFSRPLAAEQFTALLAAGVEKY